MNIESLFSWWGGGGTLRPRTNVHFSLSAHEKLRQRTTRAAALNPRALGDVMDHVKTTLARLFPDATIFVQDVYVSYRVREGEYILLVELTEAGERNGLYVIKIGKDEQRLRREYEGWMACRPHGLRHDLVLTTLEAHRDGKGKLIALEYADADQIIGVDQTLSLEQAMLDCVRFGVPTPASIADCLFMLYERLGLLLYRYAYTDDPLAPAVRFGPERLDDRLMENLGLWRAASGLAFDVRATANTAADTAGLSDVFLAPLRFGEEVARSGQPVPRLRRGHAHGDLHGRNVLVGRIGDRVLWPAVFDYGDMGIDKLIGWDFVKLETEFKIRAYSTLFNQKRILNFAAEVIRLERDLDVDTESCRDDMTRWPEAPQSNEPVDRFRWLVLMIRRHASHHLEHYCGRVREWLAEYYFLTALYGLNGIRFGNLEFEQRLAGYLSAGVAASRYVYNL